MFGSRGVFGGIAKNKTTSVQEQLSNIRESISSARNSKSAPVAPSSQSRPQHQQVPMRNFIEDSQRLQNTCDAGPIGSFPFVSGKNPNSVMGGNRLFSDAATLSQATTATLETVTPVFGGDDSFRKQQRGSQGSGGNFSSQDKFSFIGSDTIEIMEAVRSAQKDINLLKNMILTRFDCLDSSIAQLSAVVAELQQSRCDANDTKITHTSYIDLAHGDTACSDDLFRRDLSPETRRSSRLAPKGVHHASPKNTMQEAESESDFESKIQRHQQSIKSSRLPTRQSTAAPKTTARNK